MDSRQAAVDMVADPRPGRAAVARSAYRTPTRQRGVIERAALVGRLVDSDGARMVVVSAPAGYGKTTTLGLWEDVDGRPFAWVHLDAADDDPSHLLYHVALAMGMVQPIDPAVLRAVTGAGRSVDADMMPSLGRWLEGSGGFVLVLDDVHLLTSVAALHCVERLSAFLPEGSQLVLSGRSPPKLTLARQRMGDRIVDLDASDLTMGDGEAALLLAHVGVGVDGETVRELVQRTEGWPGGLHLAALALARRDASSAMIVSGRDRLVADYLVEEVLAGLAEETVDFLERSAVLGRMRATLLDELLEIDRSETLLRELERSGNMFLVPLDREGTWYRYHHLFREMLRARLEARDPVAAQALERRASRLLERQGDVDAALRHACEGRDFGRVADLILRHVSQLVFQGRVVRLGQWLDLLGPESMDHLPAAAIAWAWYGMAVGDRELILQATLAAERSDRPGALADGSPSVAVAAAIVKALTALEGLPGILRDTDIVRQAGDRTSNPWWTIATVVRGTAMSMLGELDAAYELLAESLPTVTDAPGVEAAALAHLALIELQRGDLQEADRLATRALGITDRHNLDAVMIMIPVFAVGALVAARQRRPDESRRAAGRAQILLARLDGLAPRTMLFGCLLLAQAALTLDRRAEARELATEAERARRRDPTATHLNEQLDQLRDQLATGAQLRTRGAPSLSRAELRVLPYLATNLPLQDIADQLFISRNTVKTHTLAIYRKLGVSSRRDAVLAARHIGLMTG